MALIKENGDPIANIPAAGVAAFLAENASKDLTVEYSAAEVRATVRDEIHQNAGDLHSLLGTASDAGGLVLVELLRVATGLAAASNLAEMRAAAQPLADLGAPFLAQIDDGSVQLPYAGKGAATVLEDVSRRGAAVSAALAAAAG